MIMTITITVTFTIAITGTTEETQKHAVVCGTGVLL